MTKKHPHAGEFAPIDDGIAGLPLFNAAREPREMKRVPISLAARQYVFVRDDGMCRRCRITAAHDRIDIDHIYPVAQGVIHVTNLRLLCATCNQAKSDHWPAHFDQLHWAENAERYRRNDPPIPPTLETRTPRHLRRGTVA